MVTVVMVLVTCRGKFIPRGEQVGEFMGFL